MSDNGDEFKNIVEDDLTIIGEPESYNKTPATSTPNNQGIPTVLTPNSN
jgi:hypothetical protein